MITKTELLQVIRDGLANNVITPQDIQAILPTQPSTQYIGQTITSTHVVPPKPADARKLSAIDTMFYLAGIILYASLMVLAFQSADGDFMYSSIMLFGAGLTLWLLVFVLGRQAQPSEVRRGFLNTSVVSGSLSLISGAVSAVASYSDGSGIAMVAFMLSLVFVALGIAHIVFDMLRRHLVLIVFGVLLLVVAFPTGLMALLSTNNSLQSSVDIWAAIGIATSALLMYGGRIAARSTPERRWLTDSFDSFAIFMAVGAIYVASIASSVAVVWQLGLLLAVLGAFYLSIRTQSKNFLFTASLYLVLLLITVSFKYFAGAGVAFSLALSGVSLLATAFLAISINKRYIKFN